MEPRTSAAADAPPPSPRRPRRSMWLWLALAFAVGFVLFAFVLMRGKEDNDFFRSGTTEPEERAPEYAPLPAPLPAGQEDTVGLPPPPADMQEGERSPEVADAPAPPPVQQRREQPPARAVSSKAEPIPGQTPAPRYPPQALRRGEQGTVIVRAEIGPDGIPTAVSLAAGSGSRTLDRAALDAVRQWRFKPAVENGRPTVGSVIVPIDFARQ